MTNRVVLDNGSWFDADAAQKWTVSLTSMGLPMGTETLWRTKRGSFILERTESRMLGEPSDVSRSFKSDVEAVAWMLKNGVQNIPEDLGDEIRELEV